MNTPNVLYMQCRTKVFTLCIHILVVIAVFRNLSSPRALITPLPHRCLTLAALVFQEVLLPVCMYICVYPCVYLCWLMMQFYTCISTHVTSFLTHPLPAGIVVGSVAGAGILTTGTVIYLKRRRTQTRHTLDTYNPFQSGSDKDPLGGDSVL